tara:strand:- start:2522 stop:3625 length:1104 start_codon:yes stop_codon:yes gene_type:complete
MNFKRNKYLRHLIALIILASCSTTSKNLNLNSIEFLEEENPKEFLEIYDYQSYFNNDLETIQAAIDGQNLNQEELINAKILKRNYQKILTKKKYSLGLKPNHQYSKELIELIYKLNLPVHIYWDEKKQIFLPENLLSQKINGFCSSIYDDAITSINQEINRNSDSILIIYSEEYKSFIEKLEPKNKDFIKIKYISNNSQAFSAEILGINISNQRFRKISNLNPNQSLNFSPRSRSDFQQIIILLNPQEYKSMIPALRYHAGNSFKYLNFISSLEEINTPLQLLDYEDSLTPLSIYLTSKIKKDASLSLERFLELGALHEWLLVQILKQAEVPSAKINGVTGSIIYQYNSCTKRKIPLQRIKANLISS